MKVQFAKYDFRIISSRSFISYKPRNAVGQSSLGHHISTNALHANIILVYWAFGKILSTGTVSEFDPKPEFYDSVSTTKPFDTFAIILVYCVNPIEEFSFISISCLIVAPFVDVW